MLRTVLVSLLMMALILGCTDQKSDSENVENNGLVPGEISYSVPADWKSEKPKSSMRKAQYRIPGFEGAEDAEMAVFVFPGTGGSVLH